MNCLQDYLYLVGKNVEFGRNSAYSKDGNFHFYFKNMFEFKLYVLL